MSLQPHEIVDSYIAELEKHMSDLKAGRAGNKYEVHDFAEILSVHPHDLSNSIHDVFGKSPHDIYKEKLMCIARELLLGRKMSVAQIAEQLVFEPSDFAQSFQTYQGVSPCIFLEAATDNVKPS